MKQAEAFEHAWYCWLADLEYRAEMIECGVQALVQDHDSPKLCELAGAKVLPGEELRALFLRAADANGARCQVFPLKGVPTERCSH